MPTPAGLPEYTGDASIEQYPGTQSYNDLPSSLQSRIEKVADANPTLMNDPQSVLALAQATGVNPEQTALALKYADTLNQRANSCNSNEKGPARPGVWGDITSTVGDVAKGVGGAVSGIYDAASNAANRLTLSGAELAGLHGTSGYHDLWKTTVNLGENVNPLNDKSVLYLAPHVLAYEESMVRNHGYAYALGNIIPAVAGAVVTDGATAAAEGGTEGALASDQAIVDAANAAQKSGAELTDEQKVQAAEAAARIADNAKRADEIKAAQAERIAARGRTFQAASKTAKAIAAPLRPVMKGLEFVSRPGRSIPLNAFYATTAAQAQGQDPKLWEQTANGTVIGADGKPVSAVGEALQMLGANPNSTFYKTTDTLGTAYLTAFASDPFAAAGTIAKTAKSAEGFSGALSNWWGGTGIRSADDIEATAKQYPAIQRAYSYMATHNAAEIYAQFKGTISHDLALKLGDAKDLPSVYSAYREVINTMSKVADGRGIVIMDSPKIGLWSGFKTVLKGKIASQFTTIGEALGSDQIFSKEVARALAENRFDVKSDGAAFYATTADVRWRTVWKRKLANQFYHEAMWVDKSALKLENVKIQPGDPNAVGPMMDLARMAMMPNETVKAMGDFLIHAKDPQDYTRAYTNIMKEIVKNLAWAGLPHTTLDLLGTAMEDEVYKNVVALVGVDGGGRDGVYVANDPDGFFSRVGNPEKDTSGMSVAVDDTQTGSLRMLRARDVKNLAKAMREAALIASKDARDLTQPIQDFQQLSRAIRYASVDIRDATSNWRQILESALPAEADKTYRTAFNAKTKEISESLANLVKNKSMTAPEKFLSIYQKVSDDQAALASKLNVRTSRARYDANATILSALNAAIPESSMFPREDFLQYARDIAERRNVAKDDRADFVERYADQMQKARQRDPNYRSDWQQTVDFLNRTQSKVFVPLALLSNGWAIRVSISELLLNGFRYGWGNMLQTQLTNSILKHELVDDSRLFARSDAKHWWSLAGEGKLSPVKDMPENASLLLKSQNVAARALRIGRDIVAGSLLGIEQTLLEGFDEAERLRLMDHSVSTIMRHQGYMPMDVHQVEGSVYDPGILNQKIAEKFVDIDAQGRVGLIKASRTGKYVPVSLGQSGYAQGMREALLRQGSSELKAPLYEHLYEKTMQRGIEEVAKGMEKSPDKLLDSAVKHVKGYYENFPKLTEKMESEKGFSFRQRTRELLQEAKPSGPIEGFILDLGAKTFNSKPEKDALMAELRDIAESKLRSLPEPELAKYRRSESTLLREGETDPIKNWAEVMAHDAVHHVSGFLPVKDKDGLEKPIFHGTLIRQVTNVDKVKSVQSLAEELRDMGVTAPRGIPTRGFEAYHAITEASGTNFIQNVSRYGHERILGPIVNNLSRDPIWNYQFHVEMEKMEPMIAAGVITRENAESEAEYKAIQSMSQFVHNPKDKLVFERNMRVVAPFYFAQNQAYRRFFRLLGDNPGAAERYAKMCFALTNSVAASTQNGQSPTLYITGSQMLTGVTGKVFGFEGISPLIGLAGSPTSINTIVPTGSSTGMDMFGTFMRPSWGPVVDIPVKWAHEHFFQNDELVNKAYESFLGPVSSRTSIWDDIFPNSAVRATLTIADSLYGKTDPALLSTQLSVMKATTSELYQKLYDEAYAKYAESYKQQGNSQSQVVQLVRANADLEFTNFFNGGINGKQAQEFLDQMHSQALALFILKSAISMGSPVAISTMERFSQEPRLQAILNEKNKDGTPKYSVSEGLDLFAQQNPSHLLDLVSKTNGEYESYPETTAALGFITQHKSVVEKYPYGAAFLVPQTGQYSSAAYQLETSMGLRQMDTPDNFLKAVLVSVGDDYYYNYLRPLAMSQPGGSTTYSDGTVGLSYEGQKTLATMTNAYATQSNPTWGEYGSVLDTTNKGSTAYQAFEDIKAMLRDPQAAPLFGGNKKTYEQLVIQTESFQQQLQQTPASGVSALRSQWYDYCSMLAEQKDLKAEGYFITSIMRRLGTKAGL